MESGIWGMVVMLATMATVLLMIGQVESKLYVVGKDQGWSSTGSFNYTDWAETKNFYVGDWLYFLYANFKQEYSVLQVNETAFDTCDSSQIIANWTTGHGRDVVPLNHTGYFFFISGGGFCYGGMKMAVLVEDPPPPPQAAPIHSGSSSVMLKGRFVLPLLFAVFAVWDLFLRVW